MSRPLRIQFEGAWYHVMNRGRGRQRVFSDRSGYESFLVTLGEAAARFRVEIHAYCLMPNHYHLLLRTPEANLNRVMRHIDGIYTQRHNKLTKTDGPLFRGRYKAILVEADSYLLAVSRYIHRNPVEGRRPLVKRLEKWAWSSYPAYIEKAPAPRWLVRQAIYEMLHGSRNVRRYRAFVEAPVDEELKAFYGKERRPPVLGGDAFRARVLRSARIPEEVPQVQSRPYRSLESVLRAVAEEYGATVSALTQRGQGGRRNAARQLAMLVAREETSETLADLAKAFGGVHYSAISQGVARIKLRMEGEPALRKRYESIKSRLDP